MHEYGRGRFGESATWQLGQDKNKLVRFAKNMFLVQGATEVHF